MYQDYHLRYDKCESNSQVQYITFQVVASRALTSPQSTHTVPAKLQVRQAPSTAAFMCLVRDAAWERQRSAPMSCSIVDFGYKLGYETLLSLTSAHICDRP